MCLSTALLDDRESWFICCCTAQFTDARLQMDVYGYVVKRYCRLGGWAELAGKEVAGS